MIILLGFAFLAGIVTILSPCILPILPIVLSSSVDTSGKKRPLGVVIGFVASFTFFTLFLSAIVKSTGLSADFLRNFSVVILLVFGLALVLPQFNLIIEKLFSKLANLAPQSQNHKGFFGGIIVGLSLGLLWTPCVGPILASVISLALTGTVSYAAFVITLAYALGTAIPMFIIMIVGNTALQKVPWLLRNTAKIQKAFGVLMVITAIGIFFNIDRRFQTYVLQVFPNYGTGLTKFEDNETVRNQLNVINETGVDNSIIGKPMDSKTLPIGPKAPEIITGGEWFNLPEFAVNNNLKLSDLKGKVVIIDFWTYSCINCIRTLPYLKQWHDKYNNEGLVIIGVHAPEFEFEKNPDNVLKALNDFDIKYPVVQDNNFATWQSYNNRYWPAKYIVDKDGFIRYTHFGEGAYDETEEVIQTLLKETGVDTSNIEISNSVYQTYSNTPELYLGYLRINSLVQVSEIKEDIVTKYTKPNNIPKNKFAYDGDWLIADEYSNPKNGSALILNFDAKEVFIVAKPKPGLSKDSNVKFKVYVDDKMQVFGEDVLDGEVTVESDRLYKIIKLDKKGNHILKLEFDNDNLELYAFTFG